MPGSLHPGTAVDAASRTNAAERPSRVVIAEFEVRPDALADFIAMATRFAQECLPHEPGCRQFDVVERQATTPGVLFCEACDGADAFDAQGRSPHLARFKAAFPPLIVAERPLRRSLR